MIVGDIHEVEIFPKLHVKCKIDLAHGGVGCGYKIMLYFPTFTV